MRKLRLLVYIAIFFFACASHQARQEKVVTDYIENHPGLNPQILDSLNKGIIVPGMSYEQVLVAGGIIASNHRNHSIWVVDSEGYLRFPSTVIPENVLTASIVENRTQYNSVYPTKFVVYFERGKVTKVAQTYKLHHLKN